MEHVREDRLGNPGYVWTESTLGGNPVSSAAALATLDELVRPGGYEQLDRPGTYLRAQLRSVLARRHVEAQVIGHGPLAQVVFTSEPVRDYCSMLRSDRTRARRTMLRPLELGVFLNPMGTKLYLSLAHDDESCRTLADRLDLALADRV